MQVSDTTALVLDRYLLGGATTGPSGGPTDAGGTKPLAQWTEAEISEFAPRIAIADTLSDTSSSIAVVELRKGSLDELSGHLYQMLTQVELAEQAALDGDQETVAAAETELARLETELSKFIGQNTNGQITNTLTADEASQIDNQVIRILDTQSPSVSSQYLAAIEVDMATVITHAHSAAGCPICAAMTTQSGSTNDAYELDYTATTNTSNGSSATSSISASGVGYIDPLLKQLAWDLQDGETLSYSFYLGDSVVPYTASYSEPYEQHSVEIADAQKDELRAAYSTWTSYAPFAFEEVTETASGLVVGDLRNAYINRYSGDDLAGTAAFAYYPYNNNVGGDTWYVEPNTVTTNATFADDTYGRMTALHEIGHSIGLSHPFDGGSGSGETLTGNGYTDTMRQSVMSYTQTDYVTYYQSSGSLASKNIYSNTPMIYDVAAVEYLYGDITDANTGNTTYTFGDTDHQRIKTIVDSGGTDTIDLSSSRHRSVVDLTPGSLSSVGYATEAEQEAYWATQGYSLAAVQSFISPTQLFKGNDNLGIAFSATIENIVGSAGDDQFTGNSVGNVIEGNSGDDTIVGGGGDDYAVFNGNYADYSITGAYASSYQVVDSNTSDGDDGTDTVSGVEFFEFADFTYNTVTGALTSTNTGGALGGAAATFSPSATSVAVGGGGGGGGGAPPKTRAATVTIGDSNSSTSARMAAAHGLRGLDLTTREGREEALIILSISMATTSGQRSGMAASLSAINDAQTAAMSAMTASNRTSSQIQSGQDAEKTVRKIVQDAGSLLLATNTQDRQSLVTVIESTGKTS